MEDLCVTPGVRQEVPHTRLKQAEAPGVCHMTEDVNVGNVNLSSWVFGGYISQGGAGGYTWKAAIISLGSGCWTVSRCLHLGPGVLEQSKY